MLVHTVFAIGTISMGIYWRLSWQQWGFLALAIGLVLVSETVNTALEHLTDLASPGYSSWHVQPKI